jgi:hypothetical protein
MASKIRPARMAAMNVQWGDVVIEAPSDGGRVIGTVIGVERAQERVRFTVRTRTGQIQWPQPPRQAVREEASVWVHVPAGSA